MAREQRSVSAVVAAAQALEDEITRLELISRSARKIRLDSGKNLARAAAELNETLALPERLTERLQDVAKALAGMQERQHAALEPLAAFAVEVQRRTQLIATHMQSFDELGKAAGEINADLSASPGDLAVLARAETRLRKLSEAARSLFEAARSDDFPEVAREADVLKQRMSALHKRLGPRR